MGAASLVLSGVAYLACMFVLPISAGCWVVQRRQRSLPACAGCAALSICGGLVGFAAVAFAAAKTLPAGHDMFDWSRVLGSIAYGLFVGVPLGSYAGAALAVWIAFRRPRA